jgi:hypothetical protein
MTDAAIQFPPCGHAAQKSCSIDHGKNLIGCDGISKTILWKK